MSELKTPTRKQYMDHEVTFETYYRALAATAGVSYANADPAFLARIRMALANGDEHLNTIPLHEWDARGAWLLNSRAFRAHGDFPSMAGVACIVKQAARDAAQAVARA